MQAKGLVKFFVAALIVVCAYQLLFTVKSWQIGNQAESNAIEKVGIVENEQKRDSLRAATEERYLDSIAGETVMDIWIADFTYTEVIEKQLSLGLDLQGGMSVVLQVSLEELIRTMSNDKNDPDFNKALNSAVESMSDAQVDLVTLFQQEFENTATEPEGKLAALFANEHNNDQITFSSSNAQVIAYIKEESGAAYERTYEIIRSRVDEFGVTQPNITKQPGTNRIIVELPGIKNPERARELLVATAKLEFWETYSNADIADYLFQANTVLIDILGLSDTTETDSLDGVAPATIDPAEEFLQSEEESEPDDSTVTADDDSLVDDDLSSLLGDENDSTAVDDGQLSKEEYAKRFPLYAVLGPNIVTNDAGAQSYGEGPVVGSAYAADRELIMQYLNYPQVKALFPKDLKLLWGKDATENNFYFLYAIKKSNPSEDRAPLEGDAIVNAIQTFDQQGRPAISMSMNSQGAKIWKRLTRENIGRSVAVVMDDIVYTAPTVQAEISGGQSEITGSFEVKEAQVLASVIKSGKLPAPAVIIEEEIVGPTLGEESVRAGLMSLMLGMVLVLLFMILYYSGSGFIADLVLLINLFFIGGVLASFSASLTLPGMAGIVLTIGMAVDANVIIFERIREELAKGKGLRLAIEDGYKNSYSAIIDANLTTLITGFILMFFGLGPVKGFATVLVIGIFSSFITAVLISRLMFDGFLKGDRTISFATGLTKNAFKKLNFQFIPRRKIAYSASIIFILIGLGSIVFRGFEFGVDFDGGRSYVVRFDQTVSTVDIMSNLTEPFEGAPEVKTYGNEKQVKITTSYMIGEKGTVIDSIVEHKLYNGVKGLYLTEPTMETFVSDYKMSSIKVDPTISDDIRKTSIFAALFAFIGIFLYILIRFRRWQFGLGALAAIVHDALVLLGVFALLHGVLPFSMEIDQAFIAALLTVIGYSINDTVVVFDRVREYMTLHQTKDLKTLTNMAINSTLSRTLMTSFTTLVVVLALFIFGGPVIRGFSFALLIGIVVGTYSSIFVATPIVVDLLKTHKTK